MGDNINTDRCSVDSPKSSVQRFIEGDKAHSIDYFLSFALQGVRYSHVLGRWKGEVNVIRYIKVETVVFNYKASSRPTEICFKQCLKIIILSLSNCFRGGFSPIKKFVKHCELRTT